MENRNKVIDELRRILLKFKIQKSKLQLKIKKLELVIIRYTF